VLDIENSFISSNEHDFLEFRNKREFNVRKMFVIDILKFLVSGRVFVSIFCIVALFWESYKNYLLKIYENIYLVLLLWSFEILSSIGMYIANSLLPWNYVCGYINIICWAIIKSCYMSYILDDYNSYIMLYCYITSNILLIIITIWSYKCNYNSALSFGEGSSKLLVCSFITITTLIILPLLTIFTFKASFSEIIISVLYCIADSLYIILFINEIFITDNFRQDRMFKTISTMYTLGFVNLIKKYYKRLKK